MSSKTKCHICNAKNTTDVCEYCGTNLAQPVETKLQAGGGTLIESKRKAQNFTGILTNQRLILSDLKSTASFASTFGLAGALVSAAMGKGKVISVNWDDIKSVTHYTKTTLTRYSGIVVELKDGAVMRIVFSGGGKSGVVGGMEGAYLKVAFIQTVKQLGVPYDEIDEKLPL